MDAGERVGGIIQRRVLSQFDYCDRFFFFNRWKIDSFFFSLQEKCFSNRHVIRFDSVASILFAPCWMTNLFNQFTRLAAYRMHPQRYFLIHIIHGLTALCGVIDWYDSICECNEWDGCFHHLFVATRFHLWHFIRSYSCVGLSVRLRQIFSVFIFCCIFIVPMLLRTLSLSLFFLLLLAIFSI